jgi:hypothetical protein
VVAQVAASRKIWAECPKRGAFEIEVQLGVPYPISDSEWACSVGLAGLHERLRDQHGNDSWQSLMLAQGLARMLLEGFVEDGGKLFVSRAGEALDLVRFFGRGF